MGAGHQHIRAVESDSPTGGKSTKGGKGVQKTRTSFVIPQSWMDYVEEEATRQGTSKSQVYLRALAEFRDRHHGTLWDTVDDVDHYDPRKFYTHSRDKQGHSAHFRINLPTNLAGQMRSLVQSGAIPQYGTVESLIRDAIHHRVMQVAQMVDAGDLEQAVSLAMMVAEEVQMEEADKEAEELVTKIKENGRRMLGQGEYARVRAYLSEREDVIDMLPAPWNRVLKETIGDMRAEVGKREGRARR